MKSELIKKLAQTAVISTEAVDLYPTWDKEEKVLFHRLLESWHFWGDHYIIPIFVLMEKLSFPGTDKAMYGTPRERLEGLSLSSDQLTFLSDNNDTLRKLAEGERDPDLQKLWGNLLLFHPELRASNIAWLKEQIIFEASDLDALV